MKKIESGNFPGGPLVMTLSSQLQGSQVPSLIGELGSHKLHQAKKKFSNTQFRYYMIYDKGKILELV